MTTVAALPGAACAVAWGSGPSASALGPIGLAPDGTVAAVVLSDVDGDTVHVRVGERDEPVRFIGVNTPEVDWYGGRGGCYGPTSALYTRHRLLGRTVRLVFDSRLRDMYGRLLAYVYVRGELFNLTLVRMGYATADPVPPDTRMAGAFAAAQSAARAAGRGVWTACPAG